MNQAKQNFFKRFFSSRLFFVIVGGILLLFAAGFTRSYYQAYKIQQEIDSLHQEVNTLKQKRLESLDLLSYVLSENFVEEKARTELNLKKDGEHVVVIPHEVIGSPTPPSSLVSNSRQSLSNPVKWWYYFSHKKD